MSLIQTPWTSQPPQTGLSDRYRFAFAYNAANPVEQRSNVMLSRTSGTALQINAQGVAVRGGANSSSDGIPLPATAAARLYNTAATIIAVIRADDWTASQAPIIYAVRDNTTTSVSFFVSSDGISATRRINLAIGGTSLTTADNVLPVGSPTVVATSFGPNGMRLFVDGVLVASNGTTSLPADNSITPWLLNRATGARAFNNQLNACYAIFGQLPDAEIRNLSQNPWQAFQPLPRRIFVPVAAGDPTLYPSLYTNDNSFYATTVSVGAVTLTPSLFSNSNTFHAATVTLGGATQTLTPSLYSNTNTFHAPSVSPGAVTLTPALFSNTNSFFGAVVTLDSDKILYPSLVSNSNSFYGPTASVGAVSLLPSLFVNSNTFYNHVVGGALTDSEKIDLILDILSNRQTLDATTGIYTLYADDGVTVLKTAQAWEDSEGTQPYRGRGLKRLDALQ